MKVRGTISIVLVSLLMASCSSNKELSLLHDDDVYFSPQRAKKEQAIKEAQATVTSAAFLAEPEPRSITSDEQAGLENAYDYYDPTTSQKLLDDTTAVARYYNTAYNAPQYYNRSRFRFSVGVGFASGPMNYGLSYGSMGWGANMGYGYPGFSWNPYYGYGGFGYGGYGGVHCPSIYSTGSYIPGGYYASNSYNGPRPNVGGTGNTGTTSGTGDPYYRDMELNSAANSRGDRLNVQRTSFTSPINERAEPLTKQPVRYSAESARSINALKLSNRSDSKSRSGFMNFVRETGRSFSVNDSGRSISGTPSGSGRSNTSFRSSGSRSSFSSPSRSFSSPSRGGGGMKR